MRVLYSDEVYEADKALCEESTGVSCEAKLVTDEAEYTTALATLRHRQGFRHDYLPEAEE